MKAWAVFIKGAFEGHKFVGAYTVEATAQHVSEVLSEFGYRSTFVREIDVSEGVPEIVKGRS